MPETAIFSQILLLDVVMRVIFSIRGLRTQAKPKEEGVQKTVEVMFCSGNPISW
jgi:hypothetical protein